METKQAQQLSACETHGLAATERKKQTQKNIYSNNKNHSDYHNSRTWCRRFVPPKTPSRTPPWRAESDKVDGISRCSKVSASKKDFLGAARAAVPWRGTPKEVDARGPKQNDERGEIMIRVKGQVVCCGGVV